MLRKAAKPPWPPPTNLPIRRDLLNSPCAKLRKAAKPPWPPPKNLPIRRDLSNSPCAKLRKAAKPPRPPPQIYQSEESFNLLSAESMCKTCLAKGHCNKHSCRYTVVADYAHKRNGMHTFLTLYYRYRRPNTFTWAPTRSGRAWSHGGTRAGRRGDCSSNWSNFSLIIRGSDIVNRFKTS